MKLKNLFVWVLLVVSVVFTAYGQDNSLVTGVVVDETEEPIASVTVYLRDKISIGTSSDAKGKFSIKAAKGDMLVFKYIGYKDVEYLVTDTKANIKIQFFEKADAIDEVVVVGLGGTCDLQATFHTSNTAYKKI